MNADRWLALPRDTCGSVWPSLSILKLLVKVLMPLGITSAYRAYWGYKTGLYVKRIKKEDGCS